MVASLVPPSTVGFVPPHSYLWHVMHNTPIMMQRLEAVNGQRAIHTTPVPAWVELGGKRVFKVGIDLGNNGPKAAMFDPRGNIVVTHIQAVVRSIQDLAAGELGDTYEELLLSPPPLSPASEQQETEPPGADTTIPLLPATTGSLEPDPGSERQDISLGKEWIGMHAIKKDGQSLPKGTTRERFSDPRYARFLLYVIATLFKKAGYEQGDYDILLAPGMPNEEMKETGNGSQLDPETQQAMSAALCANKQWRIRLTDQHGRPTQYNLKIADLAPGPQSYAGFYAWQYRPDGQAAQTMIEEIVLEDLGANDLHELTISLDFQEKPLAGTQEKRQTAEVKMATRERKGDGIILAIMQPFARKLKNTYGLNELDDAIAQQAFFLGS